MKLAGTRELSKNSPNMLEHEHKKNALTAAEHKIAIDSFGGNFGGSECSNKQNSIWCTSGPTCLLIKIGKGQMYENSFIDSFSVTTLS